MKRTGYVLYALVGAALLFACIATGKSGLKAIDREVYDMAMELDSKVNGFGFTDFSVRDYKVRFSDGEADYVVSGDSVTKEEAVFDTFVGTAAYVDGEYQAVLSTYDKFSDMVNAFGTVSTVMEGGTDFGEEGYSTDTHASTIWHESFHAWQCAKYDGEIDRLMAEAEIPEDVEYEQIITEKVDTDRGLVLLFEEEMELLAQAWREPDDETKRRLTEAILELEEERSRRLTKECALVEQYFITIEGSAQYVECLAYREFAGEEAWEEAYLKPFRYSNGAVKYYEMGRFKCMLLDQLNPDWKKEYTAVTDLNVLLKESLLK